MALQFERIRAYTVRVVKVLAVAGVVWLGVTTLHELMHITITAFTGGTVANCSATGIPIGAKVIRWGFPHFYSCFWNGTPAGWNPLLAVSGTVIVAIFGIWYSRRILTTYIRQGVLVASIYLWWNYSMYDMGRLVFPKIVNGTVTYTSGGDGRAILEHFGIVWGTVPGAVLLGLGIVVIYLRLRDSMLMCYVKPEPNAKNIKFD